MSQGTIDTAGQLERPIERVYSNQGNIPLIELIQNKPKRLLDVGCGAGDNAALLRTRFPDCELIGITYSQTEAELACNYLDQCLVFDLEKTPSLNLAVGSFDVLIFSHILEHLKSAQSILSEFAKLLRPGGQILIAVPNILSWRMRAKFLRGEFVYSDSGELDDTHIRFYTYYTADQMLLKKLTGVQRLRKTVTGSVPLWWLRRYLLPRKWVEAIDRVGCKLFPNLFGTQIIISIIVE